ncbi:MAG: hypothetical protein R3261_04575, partial [Alphaproteobacteria bacterium]|nr:hypothetical protein [Alphaproteobacteria bacterium]
GFHIFTRNDTPRLNNVTELEGKSSVSARGYGVPVEYELNDAINKSLTNSNENVPQMILGGRVDAGIIQSGWIPTLESQNLLKGLHHGEVIEFWGGAFIFHPTQEGIEMANKFSNIILKLVTEGRYKDLMKDAPYFIPNYQ